MKQLTNEDLRFVVTRLPRDLRELAQKTRIFIGGGFIRETISGGDVKDIDVFIPNKDAAYALETNLKSSREGCRTHNSPNAITVLSYPRLPIQIITRWMYEQPEALVASFDFTVCQAAIYTLPDGKWASTIADSFYSDLAARRLFYTSPDRAEDAGGSMLRVLKFIKRGYNIQPQSLAAVIARVAKAVNEPDKHNEYETSRIIQGLLREVDPLLTINGGELVDEHQAINEDTLTTN